MKLYIANGGSGSLHARIVKRKNKHGIVREYPIVEGERDPNNPQHWIWQYTYKLPDDSHDKKFKSYCHKVKPKKVAAVKAAIQAGVSIPEILTIVKS